nr:hypothetical protein P2Y30_mgp15 [Clonostachys byssicola]WDQ44270.1 hypothetical protein [Clonostachys byssicola]
MIYRYYGCGYNSFRWRRNNEKY